jgi:hypothetical protein
MSVRAIAAEVFGDIRFRGRVQRILEKPPDTKEEPEAMAARADELEAFARLSRTGQMRLLLDRRLRQLAERDEPPAPRTLLMLVDLERRLRSLEQLERLNAGLRLRRGRSAEGE